MYWRFGHQNASVIDHLLETGNVSLEELLEQDDLIQECKAQNPRLIEYLRDPAVLQQLLSYIISDDLEDRARFKYPFIACEVIACEVWAIFESALTNIDMLVKFWEFLDRPAPLSPVQASYFAKVIGVFLMKKTSEMLQFIKSQPEVVSKLLLHMSTSAIMDLLLKIISMEEAQEGKGTVQWLSEEGLMPWLVNRLDPNSDPEVHSVASQVLLDIIAISQSSHPEQPSIGTNVLIDELKSEVIVSKLVGFMLDRNAPHSTSTLINGVTIFIELIRRNNSDYDVEPLPPNSTEPVREAVDLSDLLKVLASRIEDFKGLLIVPRSVTGPIETSIGKQVPLGFERLKICEMFAELLHCSNMAILNSRPIITASVDGTVKVPTVTADEPLIHHSQTVKEEMENLGAAAADSEEPPREDAQETKDTAEKSQGEETKKEEAKEDESKEDKVKHDESEKEEAKKEEAKEETKEEPKTEQPKVEQQQLTPPEEPKTGIEQLERATAALILDDQATPRASPPLGSLPVFARPSEAAPVNPVPSEVLIPVGDFLKMQFVDHHIIPTCFDLFFQFPWNNFLHTVVYDMVHQVFHRPMGDIGRPDLDGTYIPPRNDQGVTEGWNRRLTISIFKDGQLTKRITDAQRLCDYECSQPKGVRLGYMGHLTYIADETVKLLELYSQTSLLPMLYEFIDLEDWWNYVAKVLKETKERDAQVLGGSRPNIMEPPRGHDEVPDEFLEDQEYTAGGFLGGEVPVGHERDVTSDQITTNLPEKFGSSDEDDDEEEGNWIGEYGPDTDFDRRRTAAASGLDDSFGGGRHTMEFEDSDEDEGVDEESWSSPWPNNNMGPATQFNASLTDWSEEFTEFKTASAEDDGFDFPPFSVGHPHADKAAQDTNQGTAANVDPFADNFVPSSSEVTVTSGAGTDHPETVPGIGEKANTLKIDMEPVALAPEVQKDPVILQSASTAAATNEQGSTEATGTNTAQSESSASVTVELEKVPLADPEAPRLQATESLDTGSTPKESTADSDKTPSNSTTNVGATVETKTEGELDSQRTRDTKVE